MPTHILVIVRHAKAGSDSRDGDRKRRLTDRGHGDAGAAGRWLASTDVRVDRAWCSSAQRARETCDDLLGGLGAPGGTAATEHRDELYSAGPDDVLEMVRECDESVRTLMLVGHNPTMEVVSSWLSDDNRTFPTCAVSVLEVDTTWADLTPGSARLTDFHVPTH